MFPISQSKMNADVTAGTRMDGIRISDPGSAIVSMSRPHPGCSRFRLIVFPSAVSTFSA